MTDMLFLEVDPQDQDMIRQEFPDADIRSEPMEGKALLDAARGKKVISCFIYTPFTADVLKSLPDLKLLCTRSVGFNHIDLNACISLGIDVCNVPDYGSHVIAEHVFALLLTALRHVTEAGLQVREGDFDYHGLRGMALMGKTLGIIGTGKIGASVAKIAHGFGMKLLAVDKCRVLELESAYGLRYTDMNTLLSNSDIITLHVPALPDTIHMMNEDMISRMKNGVIIVNTARGELIDSAALLKGLNSGKIARALLDVLEHEKDFRWNKKLITHKNVIVTPHIAFYADDSMRRMATDSLQSIHEWKEGKTLQHRITPQKIVCDLPGIRKS